MLKSELICSLNEKIPTLQIDDVEQAINCILELMTDMLSKGERIEIRGFGSFNLHIRPPRLARNPKTGETVNLPTKSFIHFKPGKELRDRVNTSRNQCVIED